MSSTRRAMAGGLLLLVLLFYPSPALAQKALHWRSLDVSARLDADGALHVVERHAMVFTGEWNGGERVFRVRAGQRLSFERLSRVDPATGVSHDLVAGDVNSVDHYAFIDSTTLRWRSRLASDPPFDNTELDYQIAYTLSGVLFQRGDIYTLDHNFALPDASRTIEAFSVNLDLDPAWAAPGDFVQRRTAGPLAPGSNVVVRADLRHVGAGAPASVQTAIAPSAQLALFGLLLAAVGVIAVLFVRGESAVARFVAIAPAASVDAAWLEQHVFTLKPEEAGALWDDTVGPPEVAAVLARLTAEKKIQSWTKDGELSMRLKEPLTSFDGYEKALLAGLFFGAHTETSTSEIKSHYKSTGFDPAEKIKPLLLEALSGHADFQDTSKPPSRLPTLLLFAVAAVLLVPLGLGGTLDGGTIAGSTLPLAGWWVVGLIGARLYQGRLEHLGAWSVSFAFVPLIFLVGAAAGIGAADTSLLLVAVRVLQIAIVNNIFNVARARQGPKKLARRRELTAARRYFATELKQAQPRMKDAWFPWLVAFGLGPKVDRWFHAYGGKAAVSTVGSGVSSTSFSGASSSGDSGSFTGGGGMSGGGGASGSWAVAAGALASGVSAPGSSGGGGGGGGGSSGGGGGGGW